MDGSRRRYHGAKLQLFCVELLTCKTIPSDDAATSRRFIDAANALFIILKGHETACFLAY